MVLRSVTQKIQLMVYVIFVLKYRERYSGKNSQASHDNVSYLKERESISIFLLQPQQLRYQTSYNHKKNKKSVDQDGLSNTLLKALGRNIINTISSLINRSMESGYVPEVLKTANVLPLYKNKEKDKMTNDRPKSILPALSKLIESVICKRVILF